MSCSSTRASRRCCGSSTARRSAPPPRRPAGAAALPWPRWAALLVRGTPAAFLAGGGASVAAPPVTTACNGHDALCDRPLDEVVLPATHNAMSAGPEWYASQQDAPIAHQLADGVRGLLIDTHCADRLANGRVRTDLEGNLIATAEQDGVSEQAIAAALRIRERLGFRGEGERGMYLCHTLCELGALIDAGTRLVMLAGNDAGAAPWYQPAYDRLTQETPYTFGQVAQLIAPDALDASCASNRGPDSAPLFLVNHWISTDCERVRNHLPTLLAVDFYRQGDLLAVVDELNGVR